MGIFTLSNKNRSVSEQRGVNIECHNTKNYNDSNISIDI
jgi:hypothetical protein